MSEKKKKLQMKEHMREVFISLKEKTRHLRVLQAVSNTIQYYSEFVISPMHYRAVRHTDS